MAPGLTGIGSPASERGEISRESVTVSWIYSAGGRGGVEIMAPVLACVVWGSYECVPSSCAV